MLELAFLSEPLFWFLFSILAPVGYMIGSGR